MRRRGARLAPGAHGRAEARRPGQRALELGEQVRQRVREARAPRRGGELAQLHVADRRPHDPAARELPERPPAHPGLARDVPDQTREGRHVGAEDEPRAGELAGVVPLVRGRRDHEHRVARQRRAQALEHGARFGGVGRTGDQRERHRRLYRVARPSAGMTERRHATPPKCAIKRNLDECLKALDVKTCDPALSPMSPLRRQ